MDNNSVSVLESDLSKIDLSVYGPLTKKRSNEKNNGIDHSSKTTDACVNSNYLCLEVSGLNIHAFSIYFTQVYLFMDTYIKYFYYNNVQIKFDVLFDTMFVRNGYNCILANNNYSSCRMIDLWYEKYNEYLNGLNLNDYDNTITNYYMQIYLYLYKINRHDIIYLLYRMHEIMYVVDVLSKQLKHIACLSYMQMILDFYRMKLPDNINLNAKHIFIITCCEYTGIDVDKYYEEFPLPIKERFIYNIHDVCK